MIVYMIKEPSGLWYGPRGLWVVKERARVWTNLQGVRSAKGAMGRGKASTIEVIPYKLKEIT